MSKLTYNELLTVRKTVEEFKLSEKHNIILVLDNIRSSYNVGSLFRTCDAANIKKIILSGYTPHPPKDEIHKTALGAVETVKWEYVKELKEKIISLKMEGYKIAAVEITNNSISYDKLTKEHFPLVLIMGNEISGIDDEIIELCDFSIEIPMYGVKHSLNVSIAAGIVIYESVKKYRQYYIDK